MACGRRRLPQRLDCGFRARREAARCASCRALPTCWRRRRSPPSSPSTCRSGCPSVRATAAARPRTRCGRSSARGNRRCSRCRRGRRSDAADYREACGIALATSDPPRKMSKQLFNIAPKIREVDACLRADRARSTRVFEVHPEVAFWRLNGGRALDQPKKVQRPLLRAGTRAAPPPADRGGSARRGGRGRATEGRWCRRSPRRARLRCDRARASMRGLAQPFPDPPERDAFGLPMAIWA